MITVLGTGVEALAQSLPRVTGSGQARLHDLVSSEDLIRAALRREPADGRRLLAGRAALRLLVAHLEGSTLPGAGALEIDRSCPRCGVAHGQPTREGLSLSSAGSAGSVLVGADRSPARIGVDLERIPERTVPGFDGYVMHPQERERFAAGPPPGTVGGPVERRIALWVLKEAVLKAAGVGLDHPPDELLLGPEEAVSTWHRAGTRQPLSWHRVVQSRGEGSGARPRRSPAGMWACLIPGPPGYLAAVAATAPGDVHDAGPKLLGAPG